MHDGVDGIGLAGRAEPQLGHAMPWAAVASGPARDANEILELRQALLAAADHERERLGRELHDGLCQHLAGIAALSAALSRRLTHAGAAACAAEVAEIGALLQQAVVCARDLAQGLCPPELRGAELTQALAVLAGNVSALFSVDCRFEASQPCPDLAADSQTHLFRIVQEAVHNAIVHGRSSRVEIVFSARAGEAQVCISDNGAGLPEHESAKRSMGLRSMSYRAGMLGGSLLVRRQMPRGTVVSCSFRVPHPAALGAGDGE
jgi:signal transduction histidine kinase